MREFGYMVPNIPPLSQGSLYAVQTYTQCNCIQTNLVNQLFQLTSEEHKVKKLFEINFDRYNITPFNNVCTITNNIKVSWNIILLQDI